MFPFKILPFSAKEGKAIFNHTRSYIKIKHLRRYAGQNEVRFEVTDKENGNLSRDCRVSLRKQPYGKVQYP
jgi:hypothetical protein